MNIVLDSNVLFSALIKDSTTRKKIFEYEGLFLFPAIILEEAREHINLLIDKSRLNNTEFDFLLSLILNKVKIISTDELKPYREEAFKLVRDIDPDDVLFIACALANPGSIIWSNDRKLKKQAGVKVLNTSEIVHLLKKEKTA